MKNIPLGLTENDLQHLTQEGKQFALEIAQLVRSNLADMAHPDGEMGKWAYLCDGCDTPFDGAHECPFCGHGTATKRRVYTTPPQRKPLTVKEIAEFVGTHEYGQEQLKWFRLGEAAHGIKE